MMNVCEYVWGGLLFCLLFCLLLCLLFCLLFCFVLVCFGWDVWSVELFCVGLDEAIVVAFCYLFLFWGFLFCLRFCLIVRVWSHTKKFFSSYFSLLSTFLCSILRTIILHCSFFFVLLLLQLLLPLLCCCCCLRFDVVVVVMKLFQQSTRPTPEKRGLARFHV